MPACKNIPYVLDKLNWMRAERIWPNGLRYTWTDAFGVVLLVSLYAELGEQRFLDEAVWLVSEVDRVLGRRRGIRIGQAPDRGGQYFHYLAMWLYALSVLARHVPAYRAKGVDLVRQIHGAFVVPGRGVIWKMKEDLSGPYPGYGFGALDAFDGYVSYRCLDEQALVGEIAEMRALIDANNPVLEARAAQVERLIEEGEPTIPVTIGDEKLANPFLRADEADLACDIGMAGEPAAQVFAEIRARKNKF